MLIICLYSVIGNLSQLEGGGDVNLGWLIGRPIVASIAMAIVTPIVTKYLFAPIFRRFIERHFARFDHISNIILMTLSLSAFITIAAYAGTSVLFGAFLAGTFLTYLPSKHPEGPFVVMSREEGEKFAHKSPIFIHTFERYLMDVQKYLMEPLFFASIGFAIPFVQLWTGKRIWRGIVYTLLMVFAKVRLLDITSMPLAHCLLHSLLSVCVYRCGVVGPFARNLAREIVASTKKPRRSKETRKVETGRQYGFLHYYWALRW